MIAYVRYVYMRYMKYDLCVSVVNRICETGCNSCDSRVQNCTSYMYKNSSSCINKLS